MSQTPTIFRSRDGAIDYAPGGAVNGGDVIVINGLVFVAKHDINTTGLTQSANTTGAIADEGIFDGPKDASVFNDKDPVYYNPTGNPTVGTVGSGCFTSTSGGNYFAGFAVLSQLTGDSTVRFQLATRGGINAKRMPVSTVAATGSTQADAAPLLEGLNWVTAANATKGVALPVGVPGMRVIVKNDDTANAVLKVYSVNGGAAAINAVASGTAYSMAAKTCVEFLCYSANQWFTEPLVAS